MIFNIQKCSIHDGNGLRTLVFLKGCPMKCLWCANPESQSYETDIMESQLKCIACGACQAICPLNAIPSPEHGYKIDRTICDRTVNAGCIKCAEGCFADSKKVVGQQMTADEVLAEIEKDRPFYSRYGGGVTFSGGEPLTHPLFLTEITAKCQKRNINVCIESCGYGNYEAFKTALPYINHMFFDVKHIDTVIHKKLTGVGNELILKNLQRISDFGTLLTVRTPIVPGCTAAKENIRGIAERIKDLSSVKEYELLAYHNFGESKYKALGIPYELAGTISPSDDEMKELVKEANQILKSHGKTCFYVKDNQREE